MLLTIYCPQKGVSSTPACTPRAGGCSGDFPNTGNGALKPAFSWSLMLFTTLSAVA